MDIRFIQAMPGHANINITQIYTHVSIQKLKEICGRTHPARMERRQTIEPIDDDALVTEDDLLTTLAAKIARET